jgi:protein gp37
MKNTNIQWTHSTINPTSGCDGCELYRRPPPHLTTLEELRAWLLKQPCYAAQVHELRWAGSLAVTHPHLYAKHFYEIRTIAGRMAKAAAWGPVKDDEAAEKPWFTTRRRHIFVSDMSDALSRDVPFEFLKTEIIDVVSSEKGRRHVWQWLTKRPERMAEFDRWLEAQGVAWPENLWAGTSVTSQRTADVRVPALVKVRASVRFLSCEPLFGAVDLEYPESLFPGGPSRCCNSQDCGCMGMPTEPPLIFGIHWVIVGGASGHEPAPFDLRWSESLINQCRDTGVACFVKQLGANPIGYNGTGRFALKDSHGGDWAEWPDYLRVRQIPTAPDLK